LHALKVKILDQGYWLQRKRSSLASARSATSSEARLIHYDLAGRYSVQAANCGARPFADAAAAKAGAAISETQLETLIPHFYARVREDALIGPVFAGAIADWDGHLNTLIAFWSSVMLTSGRYKGSPVAAHLKHLSAITPEMFDRWLSLWAEVTGELLPPPAAAALQSKAARIAESLKLALYFRVVPAAGPQSASGAAIS
jgi:hemoglobin